MGLDKAIEHKKEKRKKYTGAKEVDKTCRNHGSCDWCQGNRKHSRAKRELSAQQYMDEYEHEMLEDFGE